jgi:protein translocase SEC61 complex gamma subunit
MIDVKSFIRRSIRVLNVSHRPQGKEYWTIAKTVALGMALIGLIGFAITIIFAFIDGSGL